MAHLATTLSRASRNTDTVNVSVTHTENTLFGQTAIEAVILVNRKPAAICRFIRTVENGIISFEIKAGNVNQYQAKDAERICARMSV